MSDTNAPIPIPVWWEQLSARAVILGTVVVMTVLLACLFVVTIRNVLILAFFGILLATAFQPIVTWLQRGTLPRAVVAGAVLIVFVSIIVGGLALLVPALITQVQDLTAAAPGLYQNFLNWMQSSPYGFVQQFGAQLPPDVTATDTGSSTDIAANVLAYLPTVGWGLYGVLSTLLFTYAWLVYRDRSLRGLLLLLPIDQRAGAEQFWLQVEEKIGAFIRGQALLGLSVGAISVVGYWLIGAPYPLLLGLLAGILEFIPFIGPIITAGVATAAGFSVSTSVGLGALAIGLIIQQVENALLVPRIMDKAVGVSPVVTLLAFIGFAALFGVLGGLLAIPLAAVIQLLFNAWMQRRSEQKIASAATGRGRLDRLRYELTDLKQDLAGQLRDKDAEVTKENDTTEEQIELLLSDIDELLNRAQLEQASRS